METGTTVILLNLENLYESLYDALNQVFYFLYIKPQMIQNIIIINAKKLIENKVYF